MYLNTLICLEENVAGYGKSNKGPSGHITIMSPGIIKCYVQNLRNLPKEYTVYLISKNENKAVRLGNINAEDTNKQTTWKVDLDNLQGSRLKGKDIDCAAVVVEGDTIGKTDTVLIGYAKDKYLITSILESALPKKTHKHEQENEEKEPCECESCGWGKPELNKPASPGLGPNPVIIPTPDANKPGMNKPASPGLGPNPVIIPTPDVNKPEMNKPASPGLGPNPVIIPTPDANKPGMNKPASPGLGPNPVIIPTPDVNKPGMNKPASPGLGPCPVIMPTPDANNPEMNKPASPGLGPNPVIIPTPDDTEPGIEIAPPCKKNMSTEAEELARYIQSMQQTQQDVDTPNQDEIKVLMRLQNLFNQSTDKQTLATRVQSIIDASMNPLSKVQSNTYDANRNNTSNELEVDEEREYLNQIESVLKSIQQNLGIETEEKKTDLEETLEDDKVANFKRDLLRVRDIFFDSTEIEPFEERDENIDWVRISMAELISMPQFSYEWCTNPFVTYCYHKFGFLILGKDKQIEQYYIGIPDIYDTKRKFILSIDKIEAFRGRSNKELKPGDYGYWIVRV